MKFNVFIYNLKGTNDVIKPFKPNVQFLYPLKTSETKGYLTFSGGSGFPANIYLLKVNNKNTKKGVKNTQS